MGPYFPQEGGPKKFLKPGRNFKERFKGSWLPKLLGLGKGLTLENSKPMVISQI